MTITVSTTDKRDGKALALFARCSEWRRGRTHDGRSFFAIPGSEPSLYHMADQNDCSCPDRRHNRNVCKHMRAVRFWMAAFQTGAVAPKPPPASPSLEDERIILTPAGAALVADQTGPADDLGLATDAEIDLEFAAVAADAQAWQDAERRLPLPGCRYEDLFPADDSDQETLGITRHRHS